MPKINLNPFMGYSSKPDAVLDDPRIARDCRNVVIQDGDICNFPFNKKLYNANLYWEAKTHILGYLHDATVTGENFNKTKLVVYDGLGRLFITVAQTGGFPRTLIRFSDLTAGGFGALGIPNWFYPEIPVVIGGNLRLPTQRSSSLKAIAGNFIQVGDWIYFLAQFGDITPYFVGGSNNTNKILPRKHMFRMRHDGTFYNAQTIGLHQPSKVTVTAVAGGNIVGEFDFAFTVINEIEERDGLNFIDPITGQESSATAYGELITFASGAGYARVRMWGPKGSESDDFQTYLTAKYFGVYVRSGSQAYYYLVDITQGVNRQNPVYDPTEGAWYIDVDFTLDLSDSQILELQGKYLNVTAPLTSTSPIKGAHDVPRLGFCGVFYKGRMYYNTVTAPRNLLQYSMRTPLDQVENGQFAQYIEGQELIGDESEGLNGLIEFLGQLIIFRETSTWVLTDDILIGSLRPILTDVGCVNTDGGQGYIVINNTLFFVSRDGVISYGGSGVENISEQIQEDLLKISRVRYSYVRLRHDPRYNLLLMCFPLGPGCIETEVVPCFVYNYKSKSWTKVDSIQDVVIDKKSIDDPTQQVNVWVAREQFLNLLGLITDNEEFVELGVPWFWQSTLFDYGHEGLIKHWQQLFLEYVPNDLYIKVEYFDGLNNLIGDVRPGTITPYFFNKFKNIGAHSTHLSIKLLSPTPYPLNIPSDPVTGNRFNYGKAFRINRAKVDLLLTGVQ